MTFQYHKFLSDGVPFRIQLTTFWICDLVIYQFQLFQIHFFSVNLLFLYILLGSINSNDNTAFV